MEISTKHGEKFIIDDEDFPLLKDYYYFLDKNPEKRTQYIRLRTKGNNPKSVALHRLILGISDKSVKEIEVDHINRNGLDNRKINLRLCSKSQNKANIEKRKDNKIGYKGVYLMMVGKYKYIRAQIGVNKKLIYLGYFQNKEDAAKAYNIAALKYFGNFASLNLI